MTTLAANAHAWSVIAFTLVAFFLRVGGPPVVLMIVAFSFQLARAYPI